MRSFRVAGVVMALLVDCESWILTLIMAVLMLIMRNAGAIPDVDIE